MPRILAWCIGKCVAWLRSTYTMELNGEHTRPRQSHAALTLSYSSPLHYRVVKFMSDSFISHNSFAANASSKSTPMTTFLQSFDSAKTVHPFVLENLETVNPRPLTRKA